MLESCKQCSKVVYSLRMPFHFINPNMPNDWDSLVRTLSDPRKKLREKWSHGKIIDYSTDTNNNLNDALDIPLPSHELGSFGCLKNEIAETKPQMPCSPRLNTSDIEPDLLLQSCGDLDETTGRNVEINENHVRNAFSNGKNKANKEGSSSGGITSDVRIGTSNANSNAHLQQRIEGNVKSILKPYYLENKIPVNHLHLIKNTLLSCNKDSELTSVLRSIYNPT